MMGLMAEPTQQTEGKDRRQRTRLIIDTDDVVRLAVRLRALKTGMDNSDVVTEILKEALAAEIKEASNFPASGQPPPKKTRRKNKDS